LAEKRIPPRNSQDIHENVLNPRLIPVIADADRKVSSLYDMVHPNAEDTMTVRSVFVIKPDKTAALTLTFPGNR